MIVNIQIQFTDDEEDQKDSYGDFISALEHALHNCIIEGKVAAKGKDSFRNSFLIQREIPFGSFIVWER